MEPWHLVSYSPRSELMARKDAEKRASPTPASNPYAWLGDEPPTRHPALSACMGLGCPYCNLGARHGCDEQEAFQAAKKQMQRLADAGGSHWLRMMHASAYGAIGVRFLREDQVRERVTELTPGPPPFNIFHDPRSEPSRVHSSMPVSAGRSGSSTAYSQPAELPPQLPKPSGACASAESWPADTWPAPAAPAAPTTAPPPPPPPPPEPTTAATALLAGGSSGASDSQPAAGREPAPEPVTEGWHWQVRLGRPGGKKKWGWCSNELSAHLEHCLQNNIWETTFEMDGWMYYYDLEAMEQTSPGTNATERTLRRVWGCF